MIHRTRLVAALLLLSAWTAQGDELGPKDGRELAGVDLGRVTVGSKAPDFTLEDADGGRHILSQFQGKQVVLVFFRGGW